MQISAQLSSWAGIGATFKCAIAYILQISLGLAKALSSFNLELWPKVVSLPLSSPWGCKERVGHNLATKPWQQRLVYQLQPLGPPA